MIGVTTAVRISALVLCVAAHSAEGPIAYSIHIPDRLVAPLPPVGGPRTASLTVEVDQLRNSKGRVQFALYDRDGTIPDEHYKHWCKLGVAPITDGKAAFTFTGLPMGRYAVNILHDENANGKIDKGLLLPKEGIGFSNYSSVGPMNRPNFSKASFDLRQDVRVKVKVVYL